QALLDYGIEKQRKQQPATLPHAPEMEDEDALDGDEDEDGEGEQNEGEVSEPNGSIEIKAKAGRATITLKASLLGQVARNEEEKGVLVTCRWDRAAIRAAGRGLPVLVWPEINPDWRPAKGEVR